MSDSALVPSDFAATPGSDTHSSILPKLRTSLQALKRSVLEDSNPDSSFASLDVRLSLLVLPTIPAPFVPLGKAYCVEDTTDRSPVCSCPLAGCALYAGIAFELFGVDFFLMQGPRASSGEWNSRLPAELRIARGILNWLPSRMSSNSSLASFWNAALIHFSVPCLLPRGRAFAVEMSSAWFLRLLMILQALDNLEHVDEPLDFVGRRLIGWTVLEPFSSCFEEARRDRACTDCGWHADGFEPDGEWERRVNGSGLRERANDRRGALAGLTFSKKREHRMGRPEDTALPVCENVGGVKH